MKLELSLTAIAKSGARLEILGEISVPPGSSDADIQDALQRLVCNLYIAIEKEAKVLDKGKG